MTMPASANLRLMALCRLGDGRDAVIDGAQIGAQDQRQGVVAEALEAQDGRRVVQHMLVLLGRRAHEFQGLRHRCRRRRRPPPPPVSSGRTGTS
jgi:hypothetical protein